jgi:hypothetical protein
MSAGVGSARGAFGGTVARPDGVERDVAPAAVLQDAKRRDAIVVEIEHRVVDAAEVATLRIDERLTEQGHEAHVARRRALAGRRAIRRDRAGRQGGLRKHARCGHCDCERCRGEEGKHCPSLARRAPCPARVPTVGARTFAGADSYHARLRQRKYRP